MRYLEAFVEFLKVLYQVTTTKNYKGAHIMGYNKHMLKCKVDIRT